MAGYGPYGQIVRISGAGRTAERQADWLTWDPSFKHQFLANLDMYIRQYFTEGETDGAALHLGMSYLIAQFGPQAFMEMAHDMMDRMFLRR